MNPTTRSVMGVVMQRELLVKLKDKTFIGSTIFLLVVVAASMILPALFSDQNPQIKVGVVGGQAAEVARTASELGRQAGVEAPVPEVTVLPGARLDVRELGDVAQAEAGVRDGSLDAALVPSAGAEGGLELIGDREVPQELTVLVNEATTRQAVLRQLTAAGLDRPTAERDLAAAVRVPAERLLDQRASDAELAYFLGLAFSTAFFIASFLFGMAIAQSVVEEKQSRVVELLVAAIPVRALLAGKVAANTVLALGQVVLLFAVGAAGAAAVDQAGIMTLILRSGGPFLVFFVLGFIMLATLWAACGAVANRQEDLQATTVPMQIVLYLPFFATIYLTEPGTQMRVLSYIPFSSPLAMPRRLMMGDAAWWEAVLSGLLVLGTAAFLITVSARLYERNVLRTAGRIPWREAFKA